MKLLIIGHGRHGKDTVAQIIKNNFGYTFQSSSKAAVDIFIFDALKEKYNYSTVEECFADRVNRRAEWHKLICEYNKDDKARLAKEILKSDDIYVGMRSDVEIKECLRQGLFDWVIGVFDPRKPLEKNDSFNIDLFSSSDFIIPNNGDLEELKSKVNKIMSKLIKYD